jgi:hypothetical protein
MIKKIIQLEEYKNDKVLSPRIELIIHKQPISFNAKFLSWSNEKQKLVPLHESVVAEFLTQEEYQKYYEKYNDVLQKFLIYLRNSITTDQELEIFLKKLQPTYKFHKNLLEVFKENDLITIMDTHFICYPILSQKDFKTFIPNQIDGWYINNLMEVDVTDDGVYICDHRDLNKIRYLTVDEVLEILTNNIKLKIDDEDKLLKLCAKKWCEYCGISLSSRTLYWDIAYCICDSNIEKFENYILSNKYGNELLDYDINPNCDLKCYEEIKNKEMLLLTKDEKRLLLFGYNLLIEHITKKIS